MNLPQVVPDYSNPALLLGTILKVETTLVPGGLAAHLRYFSLDWVIACGFCGAVMGDQLYIFLGRRHCKSFLARRPAWRPRAARIFTILERHQKLLIVGFRFIYGSRSVTRFAIGLTRIRPK